MYSTVRICISETESKKRAELRAKIESKAATLLNPIVRLFFTTILINNINISINIIVSLFL